VKEDDVEVCERELTEEISMEGVREERETLKG
jgi:hypothetical protein